MNRSRTASMSAWSSSTTYDVTSGWHPIGRITGLVVHGRRETAKAEQVGQLLDGPQMPPGATDDDKRTGRGQQTIQARDRQWIERAGFRVFMIRRRLEVLLAVQDAVEVEKDDPDAHRSPFRAFRSATTAVIPAPAGRARSGARPRKKRRSSRSACTWHGPRVTEASTVRPAPSSSRRS